MQSVMEREAQANTAIGRGLACPHCRSDAEGELLCAVGWSPQGMDYGAPDGKKVHLLVMYYVPDRERNAYLKEISGLAKAVTGGRQHRDHLGPAGPAARSGKSSSTGWASRSAETMPDAKARMIKLEARQAAAAAAPQGPIAAAARIVPFRLVAWERGFIVLSRDAELSAALEAKQDLGSRLSASPELDEGGYRIAVLSEAAYSGGRKEYEAIAVQMRKPEAASQN